MKEMQSKKTAYQIVGCLIMFTFAFSDWGSFLIGRAYSQENKEQECFPLELLVLDGGGSLEALTPQNCEGGYLEGTQVELEVIPDEGYSLSLWSGTNDDSLVELHNSVDMHEAKIVNVTFEIGAISSSMPTDIAPEDNLLPMDIAIQRFNNWDELLAKAQSDGVVRVFVGFEIGPSYRSEGLMADVAISEQREAIDNTQEAILRILTQTSPNPIKIKAKYYFIPYLALDVNEQTLFMLSQIPIVNTIEERFIYEPDLDFSVPRINADDVHDLGAGGSGYTIAIIDSGIQSSHPTFEDASGQSRVIYEACYSEDDIWSIDSLCPNGSTSQIGAGSASATTTTCLSPTGDYQLNGNICYHGTHIAGIAAGSDSTYTGVAPDAKIIAVQVFYRENELFGIGCQGTGPCISADGGDVISGLQYVYSLRNQPNVNIASVNLSLGSGSFSSICDSQKTALYNAVQNLVSVGIDVIAATGNDGYTNSILSPACLSNVVSVAATNTFNDGLYANNNIAGLLDLFAPGVMVYSSVPNNNWTWLTGTSMAAPHVAGAWALLNQVDPSATKSQILSAFQNTGPLLTQHGVTRHRIDVLAAGQYLDGTPPSIPSLISPGNGSATNDTTPTLSWSPVAGSVLYDFEVATDTSFNNVVQIGQVTGTSTTLGSLSDDWYYWHVRARDLIGNWSNWSSYRSFRVDTAGPSTPSLSSPANNSTTNDSTPTFDWGNVSGANDYVIQIDTNSSFSSPEIHTITASGYTPSSSLSDAKYYWRVKARDSVPNESSWSSIWNVTIDTTPPSPPTLINPSNGSTTSDSTPYFEWSTPSGSTIFHIQIDDNSGFTSPVEDAMQTSSGFTPSSPLADDTYSWHVQARDAALNWSNWSSVWTVTIDTGPACTTPGTPGLVSPNNGSLINDNTPTFDWNAASNSNEYQLLADNNSNFSSPEINTTTSSTAHTPGSGLADGAYYWKVRGHNTSGGCDDWGSWSGSWSVVIDATPPSVPSLVSPSNGSTIGDNTPLFDWGSATGAQLYQLQVDDNAGFTSPAVDELVVATSYTTGTLPDDTYSWRVRARDAALNWSNWSAAWTVTIDTGPSCTTPGTPGLVSPSNGSVTNDNTPTFDWNTASNSNEYQLQADNNSNFSSPEINTTTSSTAHTPGSGLSDGAYYWKVRGHNTSGGCDDWGSWSGSWSVVIDATPPSVPSLVSPSNGSTISDNTPLFDWGSSTGAQIYRLQVDDNSGFTSPAVDELVSVTSYTTGVLADGTYYWRVRARDAALNWSNWSAVWTVTISTGGDSYEPDDSSSQANWITSGSPQTHSIKPVGDEDWVKFSLSLESAVTLETTGPSGDTRMWLYNASIQQVEYDDDDGTGLFSKIIRTCGSNALLSGTYYVKIDEYGDNNEIQSYDLSLSTSSCGGVGDDTIGLYDPATGNFFLRNSNSAGAADVTFRYGPSGAAWTSLRGDWDGSGTDTIGLYNPSTSTFFLRNANSAGTASLTFRFGPSSSGWTPIVGDWDGDGDDTVGLYVPSTGVFFLKNGNLAGAADLTFRFGPAGSGWKPIVGDWNNDGIDTIGLYVPSTGVFFLKNTNSAGAADLTFRFGPSGSGWTSIVGDWDGDGDNTIGLYVPSTGVFFLRNDNSAGAANLTFRYGPAGSGWIPIAGDWNGY